MRGAEFSEATTRLLPPEGEEENVYALHVWKQQGFGVVISKWKMTWRERLHCLFYGTVWLHVAGETHPPLTIETEYPFQRDTDRLRRALKWALPLGILFWSVVGIIAYQLWR